MFLINAKRHGRMDMNGVSRSILGLLMLLGLAGANITYAQQSEMTFFITSAGSGKGGDLGGLAGADKHCQMLAQAAGAGGKTWHAYLSTQGAGAVNARDRVGSGPWENAKGTVIAKNLTELNSASNNITKQNRHNNNCGNHVFHCLHQSDCDGSAMTARGWPDVHHPISRDRPVVHPAASRGRGPHAQLGPNGPAPTP